MFLQGVRGSRPLRWAGHCGAYGALESQLEETRVAGVRYPSGMGPRGGHKKACIGGRPGGLYLVGGPMGGDRPANP